MKCCHCAAPKARNRWELQACADGRKKRSRWLCDEHDAELNLLVLRFLGDPKAENKVAAYREAA
jgi:hypothetical protein